MRGTYGHVDVIQTIHQMRRRSQYSRTDSLDPISFLVLAGQLLGKMTHGTSKVI